jgi:signal peptidase I
MFADIAMELLERGHSVKFRAPGRSMHPTIRAEETITVEPIEPSAVKRGDIILYRSESGVIAHRVIRIEKKTSETFAQSSMAFDENRGQQNRPLEEASLKANRQLLLKSRQGRDGPQDPQGQSSYAQSSSLSPQHLFILRADASYNCDYPVQPEQILGKVVSVERAGRRIDLYALSAKAQHMAHVSIRELKRLLKETF